MDLPAKLDLTGSPSELVQPAICAHCGSPAQVRIPVEKVFEQADSESSTTYAVVGVYVPFCAACEQVHRREARVVTPLDRFLYCFRNGSMIGAVLSGFATLFFASKLLHKIDDWISLALVGAVVGFFALVSYGSYRAAANATGHLAVVPQTSITSAFDFGDDRAQSFEPEHHLYTLRNPVFAQGLLQLNAARVWQPSGTAARKAARKQKRLIVAFLVVGGFLVLWDYINAPFMRFYRDYIADWLR